MKVNNNIKYISLKKASHVSGYSPDYIGFLIRNGKLSGKKVYQNISWRISLVSTIKYLKKHHPSDSKDWKLLFTFKDKYISLKKASKMLDYSSDYLGSLIRSEKVKGKKVYLNSSWITNRRALMEYKNDKGKRIKKNKTKTKIVWFKKERLFLTKTQNNLTFFKDKAKRELTYFNNIYNNRKAFISTLNETFRVSLISIIIFSLVLSASPIAFLQSSIGTIFAEEEKIINFYSSVSAGDWQNTENVEGLPDVESLGTIDSFSESNSAVYENGPLSFVIENFQSDFNADQLDEKQIESAKIKFSFAIGEKKTDILIEQQETIEATTSDEEIGFLDKAKNSFRILAVKTINSVKSSLVKIVFIASAEEGQETNNQQQETEGVEETGEIIEEEPEGEEQGEETEKGGEETNDEQTGIENQESDEEEEEEEIKEAEEENIGKGQTKGNTGDKNKRERKRKRN